MRRCLVVICALAALCLAFAGCGKETSQRLLGYQPSQPAPPAAEKADAKYACRTSAGVSLFCSRQEGDGWLQNNNKTEVVIQRVWQFQGETTEAVDTLPPGGKQPIKYIDPQHGFYVYNMYGRLVGWLKGDFSQMGQQ